MVVVGEVLERTSLKAVVGGGTGEGGTPHTHTRRGVGEISGGCIRVKGAWEEGTAADEFGEGARHKGAKRGGWGARRGAARLAGAADEAGALRQRRRGGPTAAARGREKMCAATTRTVDAPTNRTHAKQEGQKDSGGGRETGEDGGRGWVGGGGVKTVC